MHVSLPPLASTVFVVALLAPSAAALGVGDVWVVDDGGGPGVDFTQIAAAIQAAAPGDLVLVEPGTYGGFIMNGKPVSIVAEVEGTVVCQGGVSVRSMPAGSSVSIRGLRTVGALEDGIQVKSCQGRVWIEACEFEGAQGDGTFVDPNAHPRGYHGANVVACTSVAFVRCELRGGRGSDYVPLQVAPGDGGDGAYVDGSSVAFHECVLTGGGGGHVNDDDAAWTGPDGGRGLEVETGTATASGSALRGGEGGIGGEDFDIFQGFLCGDGGDGGDAVGQDPFFAGTADVHLLACTLVPGIGGPPYPGASCSSGDDGVPIGMSFGTATVSSDRSFAHVVSSPVREGGTIQFTVDGEPGALVAMTVAAAPWFGYDAFLQGAVLVDPSSLVLLFLAPVPAGGSLGVAVPANLAVAAGQGRTFFTQPACFSFATGAPVAGSGSWLVVLDAAF
ncbi:MAG: hypothetical protein R3F34_03895 [Planctomycetota bacterium]